MKRSHTFPAPTVGTYMPGVGYTITQANIRRAKGEIAAAPTAERVCRGFIPPHLHGKDRPMTRRHLDRASRLLNGGF